MSNKKNLKGLAVAATFALGSTLISGAPVLAYEGQLKATDLTLKPAIGSKYAFPESTSVLLETAVDSDLVREDVWLDEDGDQIIYGDYAPDLTWAIFNPDNLDLDLDSGYSQLGESDADFYEDGWDSQYGDNQYFYGDSDAIDDISYDWSDEDYYTDHEDMNWDYMAVNPNVYWYGDDEGDGRAYINDGAVSSESGSQNLLYIDSNDPGAIDVVAFLDENGNGRIDDTEYVSTKRTVTFVSEDTDDSDHLTAKATINEMELGSTSVDVTATFNQDVNNEMVAFYGTYPALYITKNGTEVDLSSEDYADYTDYLEFDFEDKVWYLDTTLSSAAGAGAYRAQLVYNGANFDDDEDIASLSAVYSLAAGTNADVDGVNFQGPDASANSFTYDEDDTYFDEDSETYVRSGVKNISLTGTVVDDEDAAIEEKTQVRVTVSINSLDDDTTITVAGKTLNNDSTSDLVYTTQSKADGTFTVDIASNKALDGDDIRVEAEALSTTGWESTDVVADVYWEDAYINNVYVLEELSYYDEDASIAVKADSTFTLNFGVVDQFGEGWNESGFRVVVADDDSEVEMGASKVISGGKAAVSLTDNDQDNSSSYGLDFWIEEKGTNGVWAEYTDGNNETGSVEIYTDGASASTVTLESDDEELEVSYADFVAADFRSDYNVERSNTDVYNDEDYEWVDGYVRDSLGVPVVGTPVTISASGDVAFYANTDFGDFVTKGSVTVRTDSDGYFGVYVYAHKTGDLVLTAKSGSASTTETIDVLASSVVFDEDSTILLSKTGTVSAGNIVGLTLKLADKWGNADDSDSTDIAVSVSGNGYVTDSTVTTTDGVATTTLILGASAKGVTVTAKVALDADTTVSTLKSLGKATAAVKGAKKSVVATVSNAAGKTVKVFVDGKLKKTVAATAAIQAISAKAATGSHTITVKVSGKVIYSKVKTVK